jgi:hypothetical protein
VNAVNLVNWLWGSVFHRFLLTPLFVTRVFAAPSKEKPLSKHDSVSKRNRRPKSGKRVDYTARTMAAVKQLEQAAKLKK